VEKFLKYVLLTAIGLPVCCFLGLWGFAFMVFIMLVDEAGSVSSKP
jgi:hypothetical protein